MTFANGCVVKRVMDWVPVTAPNANTRYVSLHGVSTGMGATNNCIGRSGIGALIDETGHVWSAPVWFYPNGDGHWFTVDVFGAQHLNVGGVGDHGEKLTGPQLY